MKRRRISRVIRSMTQYGGFQTDLATEAYLKLFFFLYRMLRDKTGKSRLGPESNRLSCTQASSSSTLWDISVRPWGFAECVRKHSSMAERTQALKSTVILYNLITVMSPDCFTLANGDCDSAVSVSWGAGVFIIGHVKVFCLLNVNTYCSHFVKGKAPLFVSLLYTSDTRYGSLPTPSNSLILRGHQLGVPEIQPILTSSSWSQHRILRLRAQSHKTIPTLHSRPNPKYRLWSLLFLPDWL